MNRVFRRPYIVPERWVSRKGITNDDWSGWVKSPPPDLILTVSARGQDVILTRAFVPGRPIWTELELTGATSLRELRFSIHTPTFRTIIWCAQAFNSSPRRIRQDDAATLVDGAMFLKAYWVNQFLVNFEHSSRSAIERARIEKKNPWRKAFDNCIESFRLDYVVPSDYFLRAADIAKGLSSESLDSSLQYECLFAQPLGNGADEQAEFRLKYKDALDFMNAMVMKNDSPDGEWPILLAEIIKSVDSPDAAKRDLLFEDIFPFPGALEL